MKLTVDEVTRCQNEVFVAFTSSVGSGVALWSLGLPKVGEVHDVELDVMDLIVWGVNAQIALSNMYSIQMTNSSVKLIGKMISIEDGTAVVDIAGSIIFIDIIGFSGSVPVFVDLEVKKIYLFSTGL